jgi:fibronectin-binding autotransporter adhesin
MPSTLARRNSSTTRRRLLLSLVTLSLGASSAQAQQYWNTNGANLLLTDANWSTLPAGPFTDAYVPGTALNFGATSLITNVTNTVVGDITVQDGFKTTWTAAGTYSTGGLVRTLNVGTGSILDFATQNFSTAAGTGFVKNGAGLLYSGNGNAFTGGFTMNAGTIVLGGVNAMGAGPLTINGGTITASATRDLTGKYTSGIVIGGNFTLGGATATGTTGVGLVTAGLTFSNEMFLGAATRTITINGTGTYTFGGVISGTSATTGLTIAPLSSAANGAAGTVAITGLNTYTGITTISGGGAAASPLVVNVSNNQSAANGGWFIGNNGNFNAQTVNFLASSTIVVAPGKTFQLGATSASGLAAILNVAGTVNNAGTLNAQRAAVLNINSGGNWTQNGAMQLTAPGGGVGSAMTVASGGKFTYNNPATSLIQISPANGGAGTSTLNIAGVFITNQGFINNTVTTTGTGAAININGGILKLSANVPTLTSIGGGVTSAFAFTMGTGGGTIDTNGFATTMSRVIGGTTALTKAGLGTLTLNATNTYSGGTVLNGGNLVFDYATNTTIVPITSALSGNGSGTLTILGNSTGSTAQTVGTFTMAAGSATSLVLNPNGGTGTTLTTGAWTRNANSSLYVDLSAAGTSALTASPTLNNGILPYALVKDATDVGFGTVVGGNVVRFDDTASPVLTDASNDSTLNFSTLNSTYTAGTLAWSNGITTRAVNSLTLDSTISGGIVDLGAATNVLTLTTGAILAKGSTPMTLQGGQLGDLNTEVIIQTAGTGDLTVKSLISGGTGSLTKAGPGKMILTGTNTYTGATAVAGGTLQLGDETTNATLAATTPFAVNGSLIFNISGTTATTQTYSGLISGTGTLTKTGVGVLVLNNAANSLTGPITIAGGILTIRDASTNTPTFMTAAALAASSITVKSGATLDLPRSHATTVQTVTWALPATTLESGSTLRFTAGTGSNANIYTTPLSTSGSVTISINGGSYAHDVTLSGLLTGSGTINYLTNANAGSATAQARALTLTNAANSFTGNWFVDDTNASTDDFLTLQAGAVAALGPGSVTLNRRARLAQTVANGLNSLSSVTLQQTTSAILTNNFDWTNTAASVTMTNGSITLGSGTGSSAVSIGNLTAPAGSITTTGTGATNSLAVTQTTSATIAATLTETLGTPLSFIKNGPATVTLSGANSLTGKVDVNAGTLKVANVNALGGSRFVTTSQDNGTNVTGGTLDLNGLAVNETIRLSGTGDGGNGALINTGAAVTIGGAVTGVTGTTGGLNGTAISITGGGGTGAAATPILGVTNTTFAFTPSTTTYSAAPAATISGGGGTGATATTLLGIAPTTFTIASGTTTYSVAPSVTIGGGGGTGATATAVLDENGLVTGITITNAGTGYTTAPTVTFAGGTVATAGTNPTGTGAVIFVASGLNVTAAGTGFTSTPTVAFGAGTPVVTAAAPSAVGNNTNFTLLGLNVTNAGTGYTSAPTIAFTSGLTPKTLTATGLSGIVLSGNSSIGGTGNITVNSAISETGGARNLTKVGANTLTLAGINTYTGTTTVSAGTLVVDGSIATSSNTTIASGAALSGSGTTGAVTLVSGSTLSPGNSPGTLNTGSMTWTTGANYNWQATDLSSSTPSGSNFDSLNIAGTLDVQAGFNFNLWSLSSVGPDVNGNATGFNNLVDGFWKVASATSLTNGANLSSAVINVSAANGTAGFSNALASGSFSLVVGGTAGAPAGANDVYLKFSTLTAASPDLSVTSVATPDLFVLQNASLSTVSSLVTLTNGNGNTGTLSGFTPSNAALTATTGQSIPATPGTVNSTISLLSTATPTTAIGATVTYQTTATDSNAADNVATVNVRIGNAPLHATASSTTFGAALIAATPISVTPYTGLASNTIGQTSTGSTVPALGTTATIYDYTNSSGTDTGISMAWRSRTAAEASSTVPGDNGTLVAGYLVSDVVNLTAMDNGNGFTDTFILQMSYNEALLDGFESYGVTEGNIVIAWKNGTKWVNAVTGNSTTAANYFPNQAYNAATRVLGDYGIDLANNVVWAVLNHNSEFAVIPEPSTLVLGGLALLGFAGVGLRKRRIAKTQA